jgi:hypothetical protein
MAPADIEQSTNFNDGRFPRMQDMRAPEAPSMRQ